VQIIKFLFSKNGIFSDHMNIQQQASAMFLKEFRKGNTSNNNNIDGLQQ
jgi:hypothetical protein